MLGRNGNHMYCKDFYISINLHAYDFYDKSKGNYELKLSNSCMFRFRP